MRRARMLILCCEFNHKLAVPVTGWTLAAFLVMLAFDLAFAGAVSANHDFLTVYFLSYVRAAIEYVGQQHGSHCC